MVVDVFLQLVGSAGYILAGGEWWLVVMHIFWLIGGGIL